MMLVKEHTHRVLLAGLASVVLGIGLISARAAQAEIAMEGAASNELAATLSLTYQTEKATETETDKPAEMAATQVAALPEIRERTVPTPPLNGPAETRPPVSSDSSIQLAVAPTWFADLDPSSELPDWLAKLDYESALSLSESADRSENPNSAQWLAKAPSWVSDQTSVNSSPNLEFPSADSGYPLGRSRMVPRLAISAPGLSDPEQVVYDVRGLSQLAITPVELAAEGEDAIAVSAEQVEILTPQSGAVLDIPSTSVALRFPVGAKIALVVNGELIDTSQVGRTETDPATQIRIQTWYGISLSAGENLIEVVSTETGQVLASAPVVVRGQPKDMTLFAPETLPADGRSTVTVLGRLVDATGIASVWNTTVTLETSDGTFIGADQNPDQPGFQTAVTDGVFSAELQSSLTSHLVQIQARTAGFEAFRQIQFITPQRPSLVSGAVDIRLGARGSDFYSSYRDFLPLDGDNRYTLDVDAAVFATGNIGEWLYTGAYNSDRPLNENCRGESTLFRASDSDCSNTYPTYGDDSYSDVVAPSLDSLYLRFERTSPTNSTGIDYAMWGDFNTEEFATAAQLFTATNRQLHGFKINYNFGQLAATGLYANNVEGFQRDIIAPDGTSGFYFTSQRNLVPGSENVFLELEELERPGTVLSRQQLFRSVDYDIDYDRGTLLFNDPVARTAVDRFGQLLVRRIVTTYQYEGGNDTDILAGRLQYGLSQQQGQESWVGASFLNEGQGDRDFTLYGADAQISLGENAKIVGEIAQASSNYDTTGNISGTAYRLEADGGLGNWLNGRAYYRSTDAGFTNIATTSFVPGQTRYGVQAVGQIGSTTSLRAQYDHEDNFGTAPQVITDTPTLISGLNNLPGVPLDNSLTTYSLGVTQQIGQGTAEVDWIHRDRSDRLNNDTNVTSNQLRTRFSTPIADKITLVAQNELDLSSGVDPIYPSRTLIGVNWEAMPWLNVGVNQIFYGGGGNDRGS